MTIDQLSFIDLDWISSLNGSYMQTVPPPPHVNYVMLSPMTSSSDDLDLVVDMVISSVSIFSSIAWQALGCPPLVSVAQNLLDFNRRTSQPLGTLP